MVMIICVGGVLILAFINDAPETAKLLSTAISVRGTTWIFKKITHNINLDASQIIDFAGWSMAGISIVGILSNALGSINVAKNFFIGAGNAIMKVVNVVDKIIFWN